MVNILDVLAKEESLRWVMARVEEVDSSRKRLRLIMGEREPVQDLEEGDDAIVNVDIKHMVRIENAAYLDTYTPQVDDVVHVLVHRNIGALVLGKTA